MAAIKDLVSALWDRHSVLRNLAELYEARGHERAPIFKAQCELLRHILRDLEVTTVIATNQGLSPDFYEPLIGRAAAFITEVRGPTIATCFPSSEEAQEAYFRFDEQNEDFQCGEMNYAYETIDIGFLSAEVLSEPGPHIVHALVTHSNGGFEISLHHRWEEVSALEDCLLIEEAEAHEAGEMWLGTPTLIIPAKVAQVILEDLLASRARQASRAAGHPQ